MSCCTTCHRRGMLALTGLCNATTSRNALSTDVVQYRAVHRFNTARQLPFHPPFVSISCIAKRSHQLVQLASSASERMQRHPACLAIVCMVERNPQQMQKAYGSIQRLGASTCAVCCVELTDRFLFSCVDAVCSALQLTLVSENAESVAVRVWQQYMRGLCFS